MSYSFTLKRHPESGRLEVVDGSGDVPEGYFTVSGHSSLGVSDEITITHHHPTGVATVRAHGYSGHEPSIAHHDSVHSATHRH